MEYVETLGLAMKDFFYEKGKPSSTKAMAIIGFIVCTGILIAEQISQGMVRVDFIFAYLGLPYAHRQVNRYMDTQYEVKMKGADNVEPS